MLQIAGQILYKRDIKNQTSDGKARSILIWSILDLFLFLVYKKIEKMPMGRLLIGQEELVSCSSDYSTRWLAIK
jgi:hypothetical protein